MGELISIVVTSYNHAPYLKQRMDSLINQTYKSKEIIVVDDCSTDYSRDVLERYRDISGIKLIFLQKNMGHVYTCNYGVSIANGNYIMFAECDDFDDPKHIEALYRPMKPAENIGVAYSRSNIVDAKGRVFGNDFQNSVKPFKRYCSKNTMIPRKSMQRYLIASCVIPNMSAALVRKQYFHAVGGLSESFKVCADWDFWCRMAFVCDFYYVAEPLNNFRRHETTVREVFGIEAQFHEIFKSLHDAASRMSLTRTQTLQFKLNLGYIFAKEALYYHDKGVSGFIRSVRLGFTFHKTFFVFYAIGLVRGSLQLVRYILKKVCSNFSNVTAAA